jgi:2-polyprenyl-6-methoxyphenol hydroxylase-like FAD-dependent oxidoreductase
MAQPTVLISGAGIAGPTLAYWLARHGLRPTVVERAEALRSSGSPVDVRGPALAVAERMGIVPQLHAAGTQVTRLTFVNAGGRRVGGIDLAAMQTTEEGRSIEVPRGDLATILQDAGRDDVEYLFGDSIATLDQDEHGVDVTFDQAPARRFDLVVGADGLHSTVRRLAFGPEADFIRHLGLYIATMPLDGPADSPGEVLMHNTPGKAVSIHPGCGEAIAAFMFRSPPVPDFDHRDSEQHKRLLTATFAGDGWRVPELLERVRAGEELYFDSVSQARLARWSTGRVSLLGDAASCVSLFGDGSTLAMAGAATLAEALAATPTDHRTALRRYEFEHRRLVDPKQRNVNQAAAVLIPATRRGIAARNAVTRLWPVATLALRAKARFQSAA